MDDLILTGRTESHLAEVSDETPLAKIRLHKDVIPSFLALQNEAKEEGFDIGIVSGFRSFDAQLRIWNEKATGRRPLLDSSGQALDFSSLSSSELVYAILRWSALPGASRHHWGTDMDVVDLAAMPAGYRIQLTPQESDNMFGEMHRWLDEHLADFGFFRPYRSDRGGVSPERWHISYGGLSNPYLNSLSIDLVRRTLQNCALELRGTVLSELDEIHRKFIFNIDKN